MLFQHDFDQELDANLPRATWLRPEPNLTVSLAELPHPQHWSCRSAAMDASDWKKTDDPFEISLIWSHYAWRIWSFDWSFPKIRWRTWKHLVSFLNCNNLWRFCFRSRVRWLQIPVKHLASHRNSLRIVTDVRFLNDKGWFVRQIAGFQTKFDKGRFLAYTPSTGPRPLDHVPEFLRYLLWSSGRNCKNTRAVKYGW